MSDFVPTTFLFPPRSLCLTSPFLALLVAAALVGGAFGLPAGARAQETANADADARRHFRLGQAHYENGDFAEAADEFQAAYDLSQRSALLYNLYLAHRDALNTVGARDALRLYLQLVPDTADRETLQARLAQLDRVIEERELEDPEPPGHEGEADGATDAVTEIPSPTEAAEANSGPGSLPWLVVAGGGIVLATGAILQGLSRQKYNELDSLCIDGLCPPDSEWEALRDKGRRLALAGDILFFTGLAGVAAGVTLYFLLPGGDEEADPSDGPRATAGLACDGSGCVAAVSGSF